MMNSLNLKKNAKLRIITIATLIALMAAAFSCCAFAEVLPEETDQPEEVQEIIVWQEKEAIVVNTEYLPLYYPAEFLEYFHHIEVVQEDIAMEVFYMDNNNVQRELFRIYFGDPDTGSSLGYLYVDEAEIPVTFTAAEYLEEDFEDEATIRLFYDMMGGLSMVTDALYADSRFSDYRQIPTYEAREIEMRYWTLSLPENIQWVESEENGTYTATFSGTVLDQHLDLYAFTLGTELTSGILGTYETKDGLKILSVESFDLPYFEEWSDDDYSIAYRMMETINDVIQTLMSSENYSPDVPEDF